MFLYISFSFFFFFAKVLLAEIMGNKPRQRCCFSSVEDITPGKSSLSTVPLTTTPFVPCFATCCNVSILPCGHLPGCSCCGTTPRWSRWSLWQNPGTEGLVPGRPDPRTQNFDLWVPHFVHSCVQLVFFPLTAPLVLAKALAAGNFLSWTPPPRGFQPASTVFSASGSSQAVPPE